MKEMSITIMIALTDRHFVKNLSYEIGPLTKIVLFSLEVMRFHSLSLVP